MRRMVLSVLLLTCSAFSTFSQTYNERVKAYVAQYKHWAIAEQRRSGVPAAITLAQGVLETAAGNSELATQANNHFGIKCKKEWTGETFNHDDDKPQECFRKYSLALDSYKDHSDYLRSGSRYQSCFLLQPTDYASWATELRKCGYATNPRYAQQLIKIIEDFGLQEHTLYAMGDGPVNNHVAGEVVPAREADPPASALVAAPMAAPAAQEAVREIRAVAAPVAAVAAGLEPEPAPARRQDDAVQYGKVLYKNNLKGFYARKGDVLLEAAIRHDIRYARLLELNDLPDAPLEADMFVYLEKKSSKGANSTHTVKPGETLLQIAQAEGMQLRQLRHLNQLEHNEEPQPGAMLQLRQYAAAKPAAAIVRTVAAPRSAPAPAVAPTTVASKAAPAAVTVIDADAAAQEADDDEIENEAPVAAAKPLAARPAAAPAAAQPAARTINIADEVAVEETEAIETAPILAAGPASEGGNEFSRLEANLDRMVYGKSSSSVRPAAAAPRTVAAAPAQAAPVAAVQAAGSQYHTVQQGETAYGIARRYGIGTQRLMELNGMQNFQTIRAGQKLRVK